MRRASRSERDESGWQEKSQSMRFNIFMLLYVQLESFSVRRNMNFQLNNIGLLGLAMMPLISFFAQFMFSARGGSTASFRSHYTVMYIDWIFVPFNFLLFDIVDWNRGGVLFFFMTVSLIVNAVGHAFWQYTLPQPGHMIGNGKVFLPAGWVHFVFSCIQLTLLMAFVFLGDRHAPFWQLARILALCYFLGLGICGYIMNNRVMVTDIIALSLGLFFTIIFPVISW